ncbi:hypothetical protein SAMN04488511_102327 [Pedobacter suwonensis]|uniref:Uncharacterized protein n=1 Tax=Pedobacter suwonensis TaxID=332999 RepID=A0A1I0SPN3_9SPHI|nr:hypothetical protein [Pedobacter suwonensis]SFA41465.1 hypothetical protein SAMN04488511_102327 [Pedobacter suwonensis]
MDSFFSGILDSIKFQLKAFRLFWKGDVGIYFLLFRDTNGFTEIKKYTLLVFSFLFFYVVGVSVNKADFMLSTDFLKNSYNLFIDNLFENNSIKDNSRTLLAIIFTLEISAFIFAAKKNRVIVSRYNFLLASWTFCFLSFLIILTSILVSFMHLLGLGPEVQEVIAGLLILVSFVYIFGLFISPFGALSIAHKRNLISGSVHTLGAFLNIAIPLVIFFLLKGVLGSNEIENKVYFLNSDNKVLRLELKRKDLFSYNIETKMVIENGYNENYILSGDSSNFYLYWNIVDENDSIDPSISDTVFLKNKDNSPLTILPHVPVQVAIKGTLTVDQYIKLKYLEKNTIEKQIHLGVKTINLGNIHLAYSPFVIHQYSFGESFLNSSKMRKQ